MSEQQPTVGRIVHFHAGHDIEFQTYHGVQSIPSNYPTSQPLAAIITEVNPHLSNEDWYGMSGDGETRDMVVRLDVRYPGPEDPRPAYGPLYPYSETPTPGHWTWPPRA